MALRLHGGGGGVSDHTLLTNIGTNTHAEIDTALTAAAAHEAASANVHGLAVNSDVIGETDTQTLTNKTLITPTIASMANAQHDHANAAGGGVLALTVTTIETLDFFGHDQGDFVIVNDGSMLGAAMGVGDSFRTAWSIPTDIDTTFAPEIRMGWHPQVNGINGQGVRFDLTIGPVDNGDSVTQIASTTAEEVDMEGLLANRMQEILWALTTSNIDTEEVVTFRVRRISTITTTELTTEPAINSFSIKYRLKVS